MKKNFIISVLLSIMCVLTSCTPTSNAPPAAIEPTPAVTAGRPAEPPISNLQGGNISVAAAKNEDIQTNKNTVKYDEGIYIGNKNSKKFHRPDCRTLPAEKNRARFKNRADVVNAGYSPCGNCQP